MSTFDCSFSYKGYIELALRLRIKRYILICIAISICFQCIYMITYMVYFHLMFIDFRNFTQCRHHLYNLIDASIGYSIAYSSCISSILRSDCLCLLVIDAGEISRASGRGDYNYLK